MGAIRVNFTNGTSAFLNFDTLVTANVSQATKDNTRLTGTDISGSSTDYIINRFQGTPEVVWPGALQLAYEAISVDPIEFGYPDLGSNWQDYLKFDIAKFADSAIAQALDGDQSMDVVYSERTAIATQITSKTDVDDTINAIEKIKTQAETEQTDVATACENATTAGNNYDCDPEGGIVEPLNGGVNQAGCEECAKAKSAAILQGIVTLVGDIDWKHQYLFEGLGGNE